VLIKCITAESQITRTYNYTVQISDVYPIHEIGYLFINLKYGMICV
jgi:hypothetical protein